MTATVPDRFVALDSLRGIAALMVVAVHLNTPVGLLQNALIDKGYLAVDFFFVLSGFVIASSYGARLQAGMPVARFMGLRLGRLYPLHVFMLLVFLALELATLLPSLSRLGEQEPFTGTQTPGRFVAVLLLVQSFTININYNWNPVSWSIAVEIWLYLAAAIAWRLAGRGAVALWLVGAALAGAALAWAGDLFAVTLNTAMLRGVTGFGLGVVCWELWRRVQFPSPGKAAATAIELAAVGLTGWVMTRLPYAGSEYPVMALFSCLLLLVFAGEKAAISRILRRPAFVWLGTLSYSIYMVHWLVTWRGYELLRWFGLDLMTLPPDGSAPGYDRAALASDLVALGLLVLSVAAAWFTWRFVEEPCRKWSRRRLAG